MSRSLLAHKPSTKVRHAIVNATGSTHIETGGWTEIISALGASACAIEILNTTGQVLVLAVGAAGEEVELPFYVMPSVEPKLFPVENISRGARLSMKAIDAEADGDNTQVLINFYG
jgi:hypothetical protein